MEALIKLNTQTQGRDKLARITQYGCRTAWGLCDAKDPLNSEHIAFLKHVESTFSLFRKLLRFGKGFEVLYMTVKQLSLEQIKNQIFVLLYKISSGMFLVTDHVMWLVRAGLYKNIDVQKLAVRSNKLWMVSIIMGLCRDIQELIRLYSYYYQTNFKNIRSAFTIEAICSIVSENKGVFIDTVRNGCDLVIPITNLGYLKTRPSIFGICGMISSFAGLLPLLSSSLKF